MRLIDADVLADKVETIYKNAFKSTRSIYSDILDKIADALTIDAVPVVRCRECYLHGECMTEDAFHWSGIQNPYCAAGKRKEDGAG